MAAYFDSSSKRLTCTLGTGVVRTNFQLISAYLKWEGGNSHGFTDTAMTLTADSGYRIGIMGNTTPKFVALALASSTNVGATTYSDDTWYHVVVYKEADGNPANTRIFLNGVADAALGGSYNFSGNTTDYDDVCLGIDPTNLNNYYNWSGWIAHASVWEANNQTNAEQIAADLYGARATDVTPPSGCTLIDYWDLIADGNTDNAGTNLTNTGTVTFDSVDPLAAAGGSVARVVWF